MMTVKRKRKMQKMMRRTDDELRRRVHDIYYALQRKNSNDMTGNEAKA